MAAGDFTIFNEAVGYMFDGGWATTDNIAVIVLTDAVSPTAADVAPDPTNYTTATTTEGEQILDTWANCVTQSGGTMTFDDTGASVVWAQGGSNSSNCRWVLVYNTTATTPHANPAIGFLDLGSNRDLSAGSLTVTWDTAPDAIFTVS